MLELLNKIAALIGILLAIYGMSAWRREHRGKRQTETCEEALALFYEAKEVLSYVRNPASFDNECDEVERQVGETEKKWHARKSAFIVFKRFREHKELFSRIHAMRYRYMAQVSNGQATPFDELRSVQTDIQTAAHMLAKLWPLDHFRTDEQYEANRQAIARYECIFWEGIAEAQNLPDPITPRIDKAVADLERECRPRIEGRGTIGSLLDTRIGRRARS